MAIKDRLKLQRARQNMTLEEVAQKVGVTRATIQKYENGIISNIPSDKIEALAKALDTSPAYIMGWEDENGTPIPIIPTKKIDHSENIIKIAGRDGSYTEKRLTDDQVKALRLILDQMPDAEDL